VVYFSIIFWTTFYYNIQIKVELEKPYGGKVYDELNIFCREYPEISIDPIYYSCKNREIEIVPQITNAVSFIWKNDLNEVIGTNAKLNIYNDKAQQISISLISEYSCTTNRITSTDFYPTPEINLNSEYTQCLNEETTINIPSYKSINWKYENGELINSNSENFSHLFKETQNIILELTNEYNCINSKTIKIKISELPQLDLGPDKLLCKEEEVLLGDKIKISGGQPSYVYRWENLNNHKIYTGLNIKTLITKEESYAIEVKDKNNCSNTDTIKYIINPKTQLAKLDSLKICKGESIELGANPIASGSLAGYEYKWTVIEDIDQNKIPNPIVKPEFSTNYELIIKTNNCPEYHLEQYVHVIEIPIIHCNSDTTIGQNEEIKLWAKGAEKYIWEPEFYFNNDSTDIVSFASNENTEIFVTGLSSNKCKSERKTIAINIHNNIYIPNLFTPNNDGNNDRFKIYGTGLSELKLRIFNLWGKLVFQSHDNDLILNYGWDGDDNNEGNYLWELTGEYSNGEKWKKNGTVYLMK
jgi:gliding motility-associated-like protein